MPKSNKHKKARVADFAKAKLKLGKGKVLQQNATNTSISTKSIALPTQSLGVEHGKDVPTSKRNLTLSDLLIQCRHYSNSVKKEALSELHQLLLAYPYLLRQSLLPLISSISHLISDPSPPLRTATLSLLSHLFSSLPQDVLQSCSTGLVLFTISALSSLDEGVRIDALKVMDLLLKKVPRAIVQGWEYASSGNGRNSDSLMNGSTTAAMNGGNGNGNAEGEGAMGVKVVEALLSTMRVRSAGLAVGQGGFTSAASADLSPSSRLALLTTLSTFLESALSPTPSSSAAATNESIEELQEEDSSSSDPWYLSTSFATPRQYASFVSSFSSFASHSSKQGKRRRATYLDSFTYSEADYLDPFDLAFEGNGSSTDLSLELLGIPFASTSVFAAHSHSASTSAAAAAQIPTTLLSLLHPTLLSTFLDSAPAAFSPSAEDHFTGRSVQMETVHVVLRCCRELFWAELGGGSNSSSYSPSSSTQLPVASAGGESDIGGKGKQKERERARKLLVQLLGYVAVYFPFGADELLGGAAGEKRGKEIEAQLLSLNLIFTSLVSLLILSSPNSPSSSSASRATSYERLSKAKGKQADGATTGMNSKERKVVGMISEVQEWVVKALRGENTSSTYPLGQPLTAQAYEALEPTLWSLLNRSLPAAAEAEEGDAVGEGGGAVLQALLFHFAKTSTGSRASTGRGRPGARGNEVKKRAFEFIARVALIQTTPGYTGRFVLVPSSAPTLRSTKSLSSSASKQVTVTRSSLLSINGWYTSLPRYLWELGGIKDEAGSDSVLEYLGRSTRQSGTATGFYPLSTLLSIIPSLIPYFHFSSAQHPSLFGPFRDLSAGAEGAGGGETRGKAKDLVAFLAILMQDAASGEKTEHDGTLMHDVDGKRTEGMQRLSEALRFCQE